jgi:CheY-like chemotaxis protein
MNRLILAVVDDMFFASKIRATAEALGVEIRFVRTMAALLEKIQQQTPDLLVVDLHNEKLNPMELARQLRADQSLGQIPLLGFFSHVHSDLQRNAIDAGFDEVVPRSVFARNLAVILSGTTGEVRREL